MIWKSLETDRVSVAHLRLGDLLKQHREAAEKQDQARQGKLTMGEALQIVLERIQGNPERKPSTKANVEERIGALKRSWPGLERMDVREVKKTDCLAWVARCGAKLSATRFNQLLRSPRSV